MGIGQWIGLGAAVLGMYVGHKKIEEKRLERTSKITLDDVVARAYPVPEPSQEDLRNLYKETAVHENHGRRYSQLPTWQASDPWQPNDRRNGRSYQQGRGGQASWQEGGVEYWQERDRRGSTRSTRQEGCSASSFRDRNARSSYWTDRKRQLIDILTPYKVRVNSFLKEISDVAFDIGLYAAHKGLEYAYTAGEKKAKEFVELGRKRTYTWLDDKLSYA